MNNDRLIKVAMLGARREVGKRKASKEIYRRYGRAE
jgi:hypothetical protein